MKEAQFANWNSVAAAILNNRHLRVFLLANQPHMRRAMYDKLKPLLSFKAKTYFLLMA